jgi:metallo-beta-lactamase class B
MKKFKFGLSIFLVLSIYCMQGFTQNVKEPSNTPKEWSASFQPFRIAGDLYYVGTYDLACYLLTTSEGHILINTGLSSSADQIKKSVEQLGFKFNDIKILLTNQAHYDHVGAMASIKKMTGAKFMVDDQDASVLEDGGKSDYALGGEESSYVPLKADQLLHDGDNIVLGGITLKMLHHPGHTKGSCSFLFDTKDEQRSYRVLVGNMPSIVTPSKFSEVAAYLEIEKNYAYTFASMKKLSFDIWLASHGSQFKLHEKHQANGTYRPEAFIDKKGYDQTLKELESAYLKKLKQ